MHFGWCTAGQRFAVHEPMHSAEICSARILRGCPCESNLRRREARDHQQEALAFPDLRCRPFTRYGIQFPNNMARC